jgi:hypothetical protein
MTSITLENDTTIDSTIEHKILDIQEWVKSIVEGFKSKSPSTRSPSEKPVSTRFSIQEIVLPPNVHLADDSTKHFILLNNLENDLFTMLQIVLVVFGKEYEIEIKVEEDPDCIPGNYIVVTVRTKNLSGRDLANYIMNCNKQIATSLHYRSLPFIVLTAE